jgi:hypothetical protein
MLSLASTDEKFKTRFEIIENGQGVFAGIIDEISQTQVPSYVFSPPRRLLRVDKLLPLSTKMILRTQGGTIYLIGQHGDSETAQGTVFRSFRLFQSTKRYHWERRVSRTHPVTGLAMTEDVVNMTPPYIYGSYEPTPEAFDRETHVSIETARFITNQPIQRQDRIDGKDVVRVDEQLGLFIATLE